MRRGARPSPARVMFGVYGSSRRKRRLTEICHYAETIRAEKKKICTWEKYFFIKQNKLLTGLFRKRRRWRGCLLARVTTCHHEPPRATTNHHGPPRATMSYHEPPRVTMSHHKPPRVTMSHHGPPRVTTGHHGSPGAQRQRRVSATRVSFKFHFLKNPPFARV